MQSFLRRGLLGLTALLACGFTGVAAQETYPSRAVSLITPFAPGGGTDIVARILAEPMRRNLGQMLAVGNVTGAGGLIGTRQVAAAAPDGYTLLLHHIGLATVPALFPSQHFDPMASFEPIGAIAAMPMVLTARQDFPARDMAELLAHVRAQGDRITIASVGLGSSTHLCAILFQRLAGVNLTAVQFRGGALALNEVQAGRVDLFCEATGVVGPSIRAGMIKPYVITAAQRAPSLPDVPTVNELGITGFDMAVWFGLYAPARTPPAIVERVSVALRAAMTDPAIRAQLTPLEAVPFGEAQMTPAGHRAFLQQQIDLWTAAIKSAGVVLE